MERFFLQLLNMSIQAGIIISVILVVRVIFGLVKFPKQFAYLLWLIPFIRLVCPWSPESPVGLLPEASEWLAVREEHREMMQTIPEGIQFYQYRKQANLMETGQDTEQECLDGSAKAYLAQNTEENIASAGNVGIRSALRQNNQRLMRFLSRGWLTGVILLLIYSMCAYIRIRKRLIGSMQVGHGIYLVDSMDTPFVMGIIKPVIYLPSGISEREKRYVVAHERVHIRRRDYLIKIAAFLTACMHWFNPLVWIALFFMGQDMEMSCDEAVIRKLGEKCRQEYASVLLDLTGGKRMVGGMPLAFGEGNAKGRIKHIIKYKKPVTVVSIAGILIIAALAAALLTIPEKKESEQADGGIHNNKTVSGDTEIKVDEGSYYMKIPSGEEELFTPGLWIGKGNQFSFTYDLASSYMPYGSYEIKGDILTAVTSDGLYQYQFKVKEDGTLVFLEKGSSEVRLIDDQLGIAVVDGSEFVKNPKKETDRER